MRSELVTSLSTQEYVLSHTEMPGTLQAADATIKKLEDFMSTMEANGERIRGLLEAGRQLVSEGNIHAEKIREKADSIEKRFAEARGQTRGLRGKQLKTGWPQRWGTRQSDWQMEVGS